MKNIFIHHVYFWLKNNGNINDRDKLVAGLTKLTQLASIKQSHIGVPASTSRGVIDNSYDVSWLLLFDDEKAEANYQTDRMHFKFIEECSSLWSKVIVYDTIDV